MQVIEQQEFHKNHKLNNKDMNKIISLIWKYLPIIILVGIVVGVITLIIIE
jgi:cell division septal protein FtsQ